MIEILRKMFEANPDKSTIVLKKAVKGKKAVPGAVAAIQTFGGFLGFNPTTLLR